MLNNTSIKKLQVLLKVIYVLFILTFFGGIFYFKNNQFVSDILIFAGIVFAIAYSVFKMIIKHKRKKIIQ